MLNESVAVSNIQIVFIAIVVFLFNGIVSNSILVQCVHTTFNTTTEIRHDSRRQQHYQHDARANDPCYGTYVGVTLLKLAQINAKRAVLQYVGVGTVVALLRQTRSDWRDSSS